MTVNTQINKFTKDKQFTKETLKWQSNNQKMFNLAKQNNTDILFSPVSFKRLKNMIKIQCWSGYENADTLIQRWWELKLI